MQVALHAAAHFDTPKTWGDPQRQLSQGLCSLADDAQFLLLWAAGSCWSFCCTHAYSPPHPFYHLSTLSGTVVLVLRSLSDDKIGKEANA